jgi:hypothetical protein
MQPIHIKRHQFVEQTRVDAAAYAELQRKRYKLEAESMHEFPIAPSKFPSLTGEAWAFECLRCSRSLILVQAGGPIDDDGVQQPNIGGSALSGRCDGTEAEEEECQKDAPTI